MAMPFSQTLRALGDESHARPALLLAFAAPALALWCGWFFAATLPDYETATDARIEADRPLFRVLAPAAGVLRSTSLVVGRRVRQGEILAELDSQREAARLAEERARLGSLTAVLQSQKTETESQRQAFAAARRVAELDARQAAVRLESSQRASAYSEDRAARWKALSDAKLVSKEDGEQRAADFDARKGELRESQIALRKVTLEWELKQRERQATLQRLAAAEVATARDIEVCKATLARLEYELQERTIRSPIDGTVAETARIQVGSLVQMGESLGVVIPSGSLHISARMSPADALGRVRPGQAARMQLRGFPAAQYGTLKAVVTSVASEPRDGGIHVELSASSDHLSLVPIEHGMPGTVQIEVAALSPAQLVLRAAGRKLGENVP